MLQQMRGRMFEEAPQYTSFLMRIWRRSPSSPTRWLVSLEETSSGERRVFASLAEAYAFVATQTGASVEIAEVMQEESDQPGEES